MPDLFKAMIVAVLVLCGYTSNVVAGLPKERMRSLVPGPDGAIYVAIDAGDIWRLEN